MNSGFSGRWDRNRTCNLRFWSSLLAVYWCTQLCANRLKFRLCIAVLCADVCPRSRQLCTKSCTEYQPAVFFSACPTVLLTARPQRWPHCRQARPPDHTTATSVRDSPHWRSHAAAESLIKKPKSSTGSVACACCRSALSAATPSRPPTRKKRSTMTRARAVVWQGNRPEILPGQAPRARRRGTSRGRVLDRGRLRQRNRRPGRNTRQSR